MPITGASDKFQEAMLVYQGFLHSEKLIILMLVLEYLNSSY